MRALGQRAHAVTADVSDVAQVYAAFAEARTRFLHLDVLVRSWEEPVGCCCWDSYWGYTPHIHE